VKDKETLRVYEEKQKKERDEEDKKKKLEGK
jgi:hypothetical protein